MDNLETINAKATALVQKVNIYFEALQVMDAKLDEVRAHILGLSLPQEAMDAIGAILDSGNAVADEAIVRGEAVLAEADALDEPVVPPSE